MANGGGEGGGDWGGKDQVLTGGSWDNTGQKRFSGARSAGLSDVGLRRFIDEAEQLDRGTTRYPWGDAVKLKILEESDGARDQAALRAVVDRVVLKELGGGTNGRAPFQK